MESDIYKTIAEASPQTLLKEKNSKFYGYAYPISDESEVKPILEKLNKVHVGAGHFCYAWQLGTDPVRYRANDDGEPANTAGMPIYGQIQSFGITNVLVVVVRYFGGTKLGVGGLIAAYRASAQQTLNVSEIVDKTIEITFNIKFDYGNMNKVMRVIKEHNLQIVSQKMDLTCEISVSIRQIKAEEIFNIFSSFNGITIQKKV
ncbi:MAG: YigZ family protein [Flavobacterium sp.]|nr:YigZ family protein [Flavobacterium sp.]